MAAEHMGSAGASEVWIKVENWQWGKGASLGRQTVANPLHVQGIFTQIVHGS